MQRPSLPSLLSQSAPRSLAASLSPLGSRLKKLVRKMTLLERKALQTLSSQVPPVKQSHGATYNKTDQKAPSIHPASNQLLSLYS